MKIAALQLACKFADVEFNLTKAARFIQQARTAGADLVLLPEFFPSAIGFSPEMDPVALKGNRAHKVMTTLSKEMNLIIGGSFLSFDGTDCYNMFELIFPDGSVYQHKKDLPTQFENCYYSNGDTLHILHTPIGEIGVALCWEMIRWDTVKRLSGGVDLILAGSCWWDLPQNAPMEREPLRRYNQKLALETPVTFAKLLHTPLIHASHCGTVTSCSFPAGNFLQTRQFVGAAQIIDGNGFVAARKEFFEGEGFVLAEVPFSHNNRRAAVIPPKKYWIPDLPDSYLQAWQKINPIANEYYLNHTLPYYQENFSQAK